MIDLAQNLDKPVSLWRDAWDRLAKNKLAVIGLIMGIAVEQLMNSMLFNTGGVDFLAYLIVVPSMFLVTMLAAYIPARRASRIAPTEALRCE